MSGTLAVTLTVEQLEALLRRVVREELGVEEKPKTLEPSEDDVARARKNLRRIIAGERRPQRRTRRRKKTESLPKSIRLAVIERDGLVCGICRGIVDADDVHIDHIIPSARGGSDKLENLQVSHSKCNISKGARI